MQLWKKQGTCWTNLMTHIRAQHENQPEAKTSQMTLNFMHCKKSENLYGWLEWVCINLKPFSFVEDELTRKYTKLANVSRNTLEKYLHLTATTVEKRIARELPESFAVMVDGWTTGSTHFLSCCLLPLPE